MKFIAVIGFATGVLAVVGYNNTYPDTYTPNSLALGTTTPGAMAPAAAPVSPFTGAPMMNSAKPYGQNGMLSDGSSYYSSSSYSGTGTGMYGGYPGMNMGYGFSY